MSFLVICGALGSQSALAHKILSAAGLEAPLPFKEERLDLNTLTAKICEANNLPNQPGEAPIEPVNPSKFWQSLATDMMFANLDQKSWGWVDIHNVYLLDYWADFDPRFKFVLVYSSPQYMYAHQVEAGVNDAKSHHNALLKQWQTYNNALLKFHYKHPDRSLLVNGETLLRSQSDFLKKCQEKFAIDLKLLNTKIDPDIEIGALSLWLATQQMELPEEQTILIEELESVADLPYPKSKGTLFSPEQAIRNYQSLMQENSEFREKYDETLEKLTAADETLNERQSQIEDLHREVNILNNRNEEITSETGSVKTENELLQLQLKQIMAELEFQYNENSGFREKYDETLEKLTAAEETLNERQSQIEDLLREVNILNNRNEKITSETGSVKTENELLQLQLKQVMAELEFYYQELQKNKLDKTISPDSDKNTAGIPENATLSRVIDFNELSIGDNWHDTEIDGRWSGPGVQSFIAIPAMEKGSYRFELEVFSSSTLRNIKELKVSFKDRNIPLKRKASRSSRNFTSNLKDWVNDLFGDNLRFPLMISGVLNMDAQEHSKLEITIPETHSPETSGGRDVRKLGIKVGKLQLYKI